MGQVVTDRKMSFEELINRSSAVLVPGVGTALESRLVEQAGFEAVYVSGYATAAAVYGVPDIGLVAGAEIVSNAETIRFATNLPMIVDCDTGYGDVLNVRALVKRMAIVGVDAVQIEDQVWPKRCGHMEGKEVESAEVMLRKVQAAAAERDASNGPKIIARTDSRATHSLDEAINRGKRFADAGADVVFIDAPVSVKDLEEIGSAGIGAPLMVNMSESGKTPILPLKELEDMGFRIVIYPASGVRIAASALAKFYDELRTVGDSRGAAGQMMALDEMNVAVGIEDERQFESEILARTSPTTGTG
jgi:2,3-dimethylmalate lyase